MSARAVLYGGYAARRTFLGDESDSKKVVVVVGEKLSMSTYACDSEFIIGHACGGRLFAGTKK